MTERDHRNRRRSRTAAAIGSALVAVIIAVTAAVRVPAIERDIEQRSMLAIMVQSVAFGSFEIEVDGRDVFLSGSIAEEHADYLRDLIAGLQGVGSVTLDPDSITPSNTEGA